MPGIRFEPRVPAPRQPFPRMDVAGFVGFAARGPIGVPVPVEDDAGFARVFGADAPLAWDEEHGRTVHAHLAPAVRAFFRNGGSRCWVVRVADEARAASAQFALPGVAALDAGRLGPAVLRAGSPGSWADGLRVACDVEAEPLAAGGLRTDALGAPLDVEAGALVAGDLVRFELPGQPGSVHLHVEHVEGRVVRLDPGSARRLAPSTIAAASGTVRFVDAGGPRSAAATVVESAADGRALLALDVPAQLAPLPGTVMAGTFATQRHCLAVTSTRASADGRVVAACAAQQLGPFAPGAPAVVPYVQRLSLRVTAFDVDGAPVTRSGLGFAAAHPAFAGALADAGEDPTGGFPLAGLQPPRPQRLVPLFGAVAGATAPATLAPQSARMRDGLADFSAGLFTDPGIADAQPDAVREQADWIRYRSPSPRPLRGLHALLDVDEVTLVAVPDAVHRGWNRGAADEVPAPAAPAAAPEPDGSRFGDCDARPLAVPALDAPSGEETGAFTLTWTATDAGRYELQEAHEPDFGDAVTLFEGPAVSFSVYGRPRGSTLFYRVRARAGAAASAWSAGRAVRISGRVRTYLDAPAAFSDAPLREVQRALLRLCAARGDLLAVLALPHHYREQAAARHARRLAEEVGLPVAGHGALYHPWLYCGRPDDPEALRLIPPDGAATGVAAARASTRGAWVAPANEPLRDVLALSPAIPDSAQPALLEAQVNLVRREPAGFLWLSADTLADDPLLRPVGVRRLLALLRRVALEYGNAHAFEGNGEVTRRTARRSFERLLGGMFERGAFAGRAREEGFSVRTPHTQSDLDNGRLVVELRVAPARPLEFVTVRMLRTGGDGIEVEVRTR